MSWIFRLERKFEPYAVTNLALFLVIGQTFVLLTGMLGLIDPEFLILVPALVQAGEWWRLASFIFIPPPYGPLFIAFALYLFYLYGSTLERIWGALRFNLFILVAWALTAGLAFITPYSATTNLYIGGLVFLGFAALNPNFELLVFFVLPVKVKWLALILWLTYGYTFAVGRLPTRLAVLAALLTFLLFFSREMLLNLRSNSRRRRIENVRRLEQSDDRAARHRCVVCNRTDVSDPRLDFRYAADDQCYCVDHLPSRKPPAPTDAA